MHTTHHLLFIAPTAYPLGGVAVWLDYLMVGLRDKGVKVTFGAVEGGSHNVDEYLDWYPFDNVVRISAGTGSQYSRTKALKSVIESVSPTMVVVANIPDVYRATRELRQAQNHQFILVATLHALEPNYFIDFIEYDDVIDHVVVTNRLTQTMIRRLTGYGREQVHYAPYGVEKCAALPTKRLLSKPVRILYCGRVDFGQKRCQDIPKILAQLNSLRINYELLIAGDGPKKRELIEALSEFPVTDLGTLSAKEVRGKAYGVSDILMVTSEWETGPIVIWEAMSMGVPVITSSYNGLEAESALENANNCLIFPIGDARQAALNVLSMVENTELRAHLIEKGLALVNDRYSRNESVSQWYRTIISIADGANEIPKKPKRVIYNKSGRLDALVGLAAADTIRKIFGLRVHHAEASNPWPHTHSSASVDFVRDFNQSLTAKS